MMVVGINARRLVFLVWTNTSVKSSPKQQQQQQDGQTSDVEGVKVVM